MRRMQAQGYGSLGSEDQTEDLKSFERRLTEVFNSLQPSTLKWRVILIVSLSLVVITAWFWLTDPDTSQVSLYESLRRHVLFTLSCAALIALFLLGIHKRIVASHIVAGRCRQVLAEYNMSCDNAGRLKLKPRPIT